MAMYVNTGAVTLRDGSEALIRPIDASDRDGLEAAFERLSARSRRMRFLGYRKRLTDAELGYFTDVDHADHEALVATDTDGGAIVGVARYVRSAVDHESAELAVTVADQWQNRGLGTALLARLADRAQEAGVRRFEGLVLVDNRPMIRLLKAVRAAQVDGADGLKRFALDLDVRYLPPCTSTSTS